MVLTNQEFQQISGHSQKIQNGYQVWIQADSMDVLTMAKIFLDKGARLITMTGLACDQGETEIIYHYQLNEFVYNLRTRTTNNEIDSISSVTQAAEWIEREIQDLYAVTFKNLTNSMRIIRPADLEPGLFRCPGGNASKSTAQQMKGG